tara:strand:+ start:53 stop:904 length:852 start_codon:yes stop_codon:yes gene_type:complete
MKENSIIFIGGGGVYHTVSKSIDLDVLGCYDVDKNKSTFNTIDDAIAADADVYAICTPSSNHKETYDLLAPKLHNKIITIEKPTFLRLEDFNINTYTNKVYPIFQKLYDIPEITVGKILHVQIRVNLSRPQRYYDLADWRGTWEHDGGVLTNQGIHYIHIIKYLLGDIKEVIFRMSTSIDIEAEDTAAGILTTESGVIVNVAMTTTCRPDYNSYCTEIILFGENDYQIIKWEDTPGTGHKQCYNDIVNGNPKTTMEDARRTMEILHLAYESSYGKSNLGEKYV